MKKFTFKGVLDGFRQSVQPPVSRQEQEVQEQLKPEHFTLKRTFRHGFPFSPTAFAFDPVQKLLALGDKSGFIRILGRPGVDSHAKHEGESECAVIFAEFLVNEGALVTVTADDTLHLWSIRQKTPQVVQSLKFQRERVTCLHVPVGSKWLYIGTERGNIHVVQVETFALSGYIINWNKAIEVVRTSHPGAVIALCDNPIDANKLLIAFECGLLVLWDLKCKCAEIRWQAPEPIKSISWHFEGKYFVSSHTDGSICSWPSKPSAKPQSLIFPHAKVSKDGGNEKCRPIHKVDLKTSQTGETFTIFSGGMPSSKSNCITVMVGKSTTVLEMEHAVVDFVTLCTSPWMCEMQEPYAIAVLLQYDLVVIDLLTPGFPCFESPYPMDLHESPVTCCTYLTDCPSDLVPAFYSVGRTTTSKKAGFSEREWPISGGEWSPASCSYSEIVITGHQDGSLKFWDSGAGTLQILYKLKTAKLFEKPRNTHSESSLENPFAIQLIYLCPESRRLCVAGSTGQIMLFKFRKVESTSEVLVLDVSIVYENFDNIYGTSPECDFIPQKTEVTEMDGVLRAKSGPQRKPPGFQSQLICLTTGPNKRVIQVTSLCMNSSYGLMAYGTEFGLVVIDIVQKSCVLSVASPDLYGAHDPYSRNPKSPKRIENREEQSRSPSSEQLNDTTSPDSPSIEFIPETIEPFSSYQNQSNSSRPTSPENESSATNDLLRSPSRDEIPTAPKELQDRRKSMSWKTFNLKRQLSKVNMKIGINMNIENEFSKNNTIFATQKEEVSPDENDLSSKELSLKKELQENAVATSAVGTDILGNEGKITADSVDNEASENSKSPKDVLKPMIKENHSLDIFSQFQELKKEDEGRVDENKQSRPNDLPLLETLGTNQSENVYVKSTHQKFKDKQRDQRLLSVPNIKYQPREIRTRTMKNDSSPSLSGNISKKICSPVERRSYESNEAGTPQSSDDGAIGGNGVGNLTSKLSFQSLTPIMSNTDVAETTAAPEPSETLRKSKSQDKLDGSFSRSRSSSISSIDITSSESVTCLAFIDSFGKKGDALIPTLWIGTNFGSILTLFITIPDKESRKYQPVLVTINGGTMLRLKGSITSMSFLDACGSLIPFTFEHWREDIKKERNAAKSNTTTSPTFKPITANTISNLPGGNVGISSNTASSSSTSGSLNTCLDNLIDRQYVVVASEKQTKVFDIVNQCCINRFNLSEMDFAVKSETITMKDGSCLATYLSNGNLMIHSLPSLRLLLDTEFLPLMELSFQTKCKQGIVDPMLSIWGQQIIVHEDTTQISKIVCFSHKGHGLYMATPTEIQKFTISAEFCQFILDMMGELYTSLEMPEQPKESFFKGLFGGGTKILDREELFGEQSGKANRSVAKHIPGPSLEQLGQRASTAASEISRAHQLAMERGDKLNLLEERAERMANQAQDFSGTAHQLMLKYKDKKWYQL